MGTIEKPLTREQLESMLREFKYTRGSAFSLTALGYFGSFAREKEAPESDVDIVYQMEATARPTLFLLAQLRDELVAVLHRPVDLIEYRERMPLRLKKRIGKEAVYV